MRITLKQAMVLLTLSFLHSACGVHNNNPFNQNLRTGDPISETPEMTEENLEDGRKRYTWTHGTTKLIFEGNLADPKKNDDDLFLTDWTKTKTYIVKKGNIGAWEMEAAGKLFLESGKIPTAKDVASPFTNNGQQKKYKPFKVIH